MRLRKRYRKRKREILHVYKRACELFDELDDEEKNEFLHRTEEEDRDSRLLVLSRSKSIKIINFL